MKICLLKIFKNAIFSRFINRPAVLERKVDVFKTVVDRNKLVDKSADSIDDIILSAKEKKIQYKLYL